LKSTKTAYGTAFEAVTQYFYDARGRSTVTQYADGTRTSQGYDLSPSSAGWTNSTTDQGGVTTKYVYDAAGRLDQLITSAFDPQTQQTLQQIRNYDYDAANRMTDSFDALNNRTSFAYYPTGQMATSKAWKDATTGYTTTYDYNLAGEQISVLDANNHQTQYVYNERGLLELTIYPGNVTTTQTYDFAGRLVTSTDENQKVTKSVYNAASQLTAVKMAFGTVDETTINYAYNFAGQLASMTDAKLHTTSFLYDDAGRQTKKTLPDLTYEQYFYNAAGNMTSKRLADGNSNNFTYDNMNRLTQITYFDNTFANFTYLADGQRDTSSTRTTLLAIPQVTDYDYDPFGRLKQVMVPDGRAVSYAYNNNDQRTSMTTPATTVYYDYNSLGQLATVKVGSLTATPTTFEYDPVGFLTKRTLPNGVYTSYTPNVRDQLENVTTKNSANTVLQSFDYILDNAGTRKKVTELGGSYIMWDYDNLYRLKSEKRYTSSGTLSWEASILYDDAGNRDLMTVNGNTTDYEYNNLDQLTSAGAVTYGYNGRGDLTTITNGANVTTYTYNAADQLTSVAAGGITSSYVYNADGKRVKQTIGSAVTNYLWDEASVYGDVVFEYNGSGSTLASYVLGGTGLISQTRSTTTKYFLQDGQGSTRGLLSNVANPTINDITDTYSYTAFGELYAPGSSGTTVNPYRYTGQQFDTSTGLYSLRARYYNPALGRFLSQDTYPVNFGNPVEFNRYAYTGNNPINLIDPSGHEGTTGYSISLGSVLSSARAVAELGFKAGLVYGIVASLMCTGGLDVGFISTSAVMGYVGGGVLGGIAAIPGLAGLAQALGATGGLAGYAVAMADIRANGLNGCNFISAVGSLAALAGSSYSGLSGGGPSMQFAFAGVNGGASASAVQGVAGNAGMWETLGLVSMMSDDWERGPSNKEQGQAGEEKVRIILEKSGVEILGEQVGIRIKTPLGDRIRIVDFLVVDKAGKVIAVEVKTGNAELSPRQIKLDRLMRTQGGVITNPNVPPRYFNLKLDSIETIYFQIQIP